MTFAEPERIFCLCDVSRAAPVLAVPLRSYAQGALLALPL
jgi:hypothetical protein